MNKLIKIKIIIIVLITLMTGCSGKNNNSAMIKNVHHVAVIVNSIEKSMEYYSGYMGFTITEEKKTDDGNTKIGIIPIGDTEIQLIEPLNNQSEYYDFMTENGEGIHHIALSAENIAEAVETIRKKGYEFQSENPQKISEDYSIIFMEEESTYGTLIAICEDNSQKTSNVSTEIIKGIDHIAFSTDRVDDFLNLFTEVFGLKITAKVQTKALNILIKAGETHLEMVQSARGRKGYHHIAFETENEELALEKAKEKGYVPETEEINDRPEKGRGFYLNGEFTDGILNEIMYTSHLY